MLERFTSQNMYGNLEDRDDSEGGDPEGVKTENDRINLKVAGQDGSVVQFKIKRHTPLNKLMKAYCERQAD
ncbi:hypothetical protein AAFF_G00209270 [Aldrovandia affinis]|uniref:Rad60/SUMO-like domain-containing protein n=1 Tax=Aldrovandia affinis TaxID=143900 RepID=A0AAD7WUE9_9TELE|nr:hypothetical protein AAFF_G00209270 [Aldrovandia affinis]